MTTPTDLVYYQSAIDYYTLTRLTSKFYPGPPTFPQIWAASWIPTDPGVTLLNRPENMGNVNYYNYVKPLISLMDCVGDGGYENSTSAEFILNNCFTTQYGSTGNRLMAISERLKELPVGKRALLTTRYNQGPVYDELGDQITLAGGATTQNLWAEKAGITLTNDFSSILNVIKGRGGVDQIDYLVIDMEQRGDFFASYSSPSEIVSRRYRGITSNHYYANSWLDGKYDSFQSAFSGFNINLNHISKGLFHPQLQRSYLFWDRAVSYINAALIEEYIVKVGISAFGSKLKVSNYDGFNIGNTLDNYFYNQNGHPILYKSMVGNGASPALYGGWANPDSYVIYSADNTRIVDDDVEDSQEEIFYTKNDSWFSFLLLVNNIRAVKRDNPDVPLRPWILGISYSDQIYPSTWIKDGVSGGTGLYYESIRHMALTGVEVFYYFNTSDMVGITLQSQYVSTLNNVLEEINNVKGGYTPNCLTTGKINFKGNYILSGCPTPTAYVWRVTKKPVGFSGPTYIYANGATLTLDKDGGYWLSTSDATPPTITTS